MHCTHTHTLSLSLSLTFFLLFLSCLFFLLFSLSLSRSHTHTLSLSLSLFLSTHLLIHDLLDKHGLHDVRNKLRMHVSVRNPGVQQLPHSALELGRNLLRLVAAKDRKRRESCVKNLREQIRSACLIKNSIFF